MTECSVGQVGDREWWCATHGCDAETCEPGVDAASIARDFRRDYDSSPEPVGHHADCDCQGSVIEELLALAARANAACRHCGALPEADGDHSCSCPYRDEECPDHG